MDEIYKILGYTFIDTNYLLEALTHPSYKKPLLKQINTKNIHNNIFNYERLEFLGDRVLSFILGKWLFRYFDKDSEGKISKRYSVLASRDTCYEIATELNLGKYLILSSGEESSGGRDSKSNLANVIEAIIGAIFLDGGIEEAERFVFKHWETRFHNTTGEADPKTKLQEICQAKYQTLPEYIIESISGPDHSLDFKINVKVPFNKLQFAGTGKSKKIAEKNAAILALKSLED